MKVSKQCYGEPGCESISFLYSLIHTEFYQQTKFVRNTV